MSFNQLNQNEEIPKGWSYVKVKDIAKINEKSISKDYKYPEIEYIEISKVNDGMISETKRINLKKIPSRAKRIVRNNEILISSVRPNLKHYIFIKKAKKNLIASTGFVVITPQKIHPRYLYYCLTSEKYTNYLTQIAESHTSTYPSFNPDIIENTEILKPPDAEECFIGEFLGFLDDKIRNNQYMNESLEEIAQRIFKSWFIDFEPFQDGEFVESELGKIPNEWEAKKFGDVINLYDSKRIPISKREREKRKGHFPYYGATSIMDYIDDFLFDGIYLLVAEDGSVMDDNERPVLQYVHGKFWVNNHAHVVQGKDEMFTEFLYLFLKQINVKSYVTGAVQPKINQGNLRRIPIIKPPKKVLDNFRGLISSIYDKIRLNEDEINTLNKLRDLLLPQLISGRLRIKNPEKFMEEMSN